MPTVSELQADGRLGNGIMPSAVRRWAYLIVPAAKANGLPPAMVAAVMTVESEGDPLAWNSKSDARGLMQVLHGPWRPAKNISVGASMLTNFKREFGSWKLALAAYNAGPGAVIKYGGVPPNQETRDYVVMVPYLYREYSNQPLTYSARIAFTNSLRHFRRFTSHLQHLHPHPPRAAVAGPRQGGSPNVCDPWSQCRPHSLFEPITDPLWPLGGSPDPFPLMPPSG
jgi:hypothetical protein